MIEVRCHTNVDDYKRYSWPEQFVCTPKEGDKVQTTDGSRELTICGITHGVTFKYKDGCKLMIPCVFIELTLPKWFRT